MHDTTADTPDRAGTPRGASGTGVPNGAGVPNGGAGADAWAGRPGWNGAGPGANGDVGGAPEPTAPGAAVRTGAKNP